MQSVLAKIISVIPKEGVSVDSHTHTHTHCERSYVSGVWLRICVGRDVSVSVIMNQLLNICWVLCFGTFAISLSVIFVSLSCSQT